MKILLSGLDVALEGRLQHMLAANTNYEISITQGPDCTAVRFGTNPYKKADLVVYGGTGEKNSTFSQFVATLKKVRRMCGFRDVPILVASNIADNKKNEMITAGANAVLPLPLSPESVFHYIQQIMSLPKPQGSLPVELVNPFYLSTCNTLQTMAGIKEVKRVELFLKRDYRIFGDISGVMGLSGSATGVVAITFTEPFARKLIANMLGTDPASQSDDDVKDGVGELVNMISGGAKAQLTDTQYYFSLTTPTVVVGDGHEIGTMRNVPVIVIVMEGDAQPFALQICIQPS